MKGGLGFKATTEFAALRPKTYSYLTDNNDEIKKAKDAEKWVINRKLKFEDRKNCLEVNQLLKEINNLESNKLDVDCLRENHKEFIKSNRLLTKQQQRFRSEKVLA